MNIKKILSYAVCFGFVILFFAPSLVSAQSCEGKLEGAWCDNTNPLGGTCINNACKELADCDASKSKYCDFDKGVCVANKCLPVTSGDTNKSCRNYSPGLDCSIYGVDGICLERSGVGYCYPRFGCGGGAKNGDACRINLSVSDRDPIVYSGKCEVIAGVKGERCVVSEISDNKNADPACKNKSPGQFCDPKDISAGFCDNEGKCVALEACNNVEDFCITRGFDGVCSEKKKCLPLPTCTSLESDSKSCQLTTSINGFCAPLKNETGVKDFCEPVTCTKGCGSNEQCVNGYCGKKSCGTQADCPNGICTENGCLRLGTSGDYDPFINSCRQVNGVCLDGSGSRCNVQGFEGVSTAIGCLPKLTEPFVASILAFITAISGGLALILMASSAIQMMVQGSDAKALQSAQQRFVSAAIGLVFIIFSVFLLRVIGVDILQIPGFR